MGLVELVLLKLSHCSQLRHFLIEPCLSLIENLLLFNNARSTLSLGVIVNSEWAARFKEAGVLDRLVVISGSLSIGGRPNQLGV